MKNKFIVVIAVAIAALVFAALKLFSEPPPPTAFSPESLTYEAFVREHSPRMGNPLARVTVVEWFDPECESCRAIHNPLKKIMSEYSDRVQFIYRYMPYHQGSMFAAAALQEAREHGKFEQALDLLFENQPEWGSHQQPRPDLIPTYLTSLGIPPEKLEREYLLTKHTATIRVDESDGKSLGVRLTPTFFVNGQAISEYGERPLRESIEAALENTK